MLWYVIQTYTGKEEKMVEMVRRIIPRQLYGDCFVAYHEQLMKRREENRVYVARAFPGYAFITSDDPNALFFYLRKVPAMSRMIADDEFHFLPLEQREADFLQNILDENHVVRLSYVSTDGSDHILYTSGPIRDCMSRIVSYHFRKRYAVVRLVLSGEEKNVRLGIVLNDDVRRELAYGKVEAPIAVPEEYRICAAKGNGQQPEKAGRRPASDRAGRAVSASGRPEKAVPVSGRQEKAVPASGGPEKAVSVSGRPEKAVPESGRPPEEPAAREMRPKEPPIREMKRHETPDEELLPGDPVIVVSGIFAGMPARVYQVRKHVLKIGIHLFGQDMTVEVPADTVRKMVA